MNKMKRCLALLLVLCMTLSVMPFGVLAAEDSSYAYSIVHVDAGRKYFSPDSLKTIIDNAAAAGFNQVELYLSDNQGFRFALDNMTLTTEYGTYDLTPALGDGYSDGSKYPDGSGKYLTQSEMDEIIAYANGVGIDIVPCINVPGHMGAILEVFPGFKYSGSNSSIDLANDEAVAFALALTEKYASYFASKGCKFYNVGADEYANDLSSMGFEGMGSTLYTKFVQFLNDAADIVTGLDMTPRAFNDGFYYKDYSISVEPNKAYEVCYWSSGWSGYDVAAASTIAEKGHKMINTHGDYYWILGDSNYKCTAEKAGQFVTTSFQGSTVSAPAGSMFCIWCDVGNADGTDGGEAVVADTADVIAAFGGALPKVESLVSSGETTDPTVPETSEPEATEPEIVTLTDGDVSVAAPGLTGLTVTDTTAPAIEGTGEVVAYDVVPETAEGSYTGEATVSIPVPAGWTNVRGGVLASAGGEQVLGITGKLENGKFTFTAPHFSTVVAYDVAETAEGETVDGGSITLNADGTATKTIEGYNYSSDWSVADDSIVSVSVTGQDATASGYDYNEASVVCGDLISSDSTSWVRTNYYYTPDNGTNHYPVYAKRSSKNNFISTDYTYTWGYSVSDSTSNVQQIGDTQSVSSWNPNAEPSITVYTRSGTEGSPASTTVTFTALKPGTTTVTVGNVVYTVTVNWNEVSLTLTKDATATYTQSANITGEAVFSVAGIATASISGKSVTFTGVAVGTTVATVGNTKYTINVVEEDLSQAEGLEVEFWITNQIVTADGANSVVIAASDAYGVNGKLISELVPATGEGDRVFWKATRHPSGSHQAENSTDMTLSGVRTDFTHIRYYNGSWAYSVDGTTWTNVISGDQIVAYYLQTTQVTTEVTTNVVDWGQDYAEWTKGVDNSWFWDGYVENGSKFVFLDFAVVYEDNTQNPDSFPTDNTWFFHFDGCSADNPRVLGAISFTENVDYEIWKVTVTDGTCTGYSSASTFASTYDDSTETTVWDEDMGGEPGLSSLSYTANRSGKLVRIYIRAKANPDSLTVHYRDRSANDIEFYSYNIAVDTNDGDEALFSENFGMGTETNTLVNNTVLNIRGVEQAVSADLATMPEIKAYYRYCTYTLVATERSEDGKEVYLYYTFTPVVSFVADFGLPLTITPTDLNQDGYSTAGSDIKAVKVIGTYDTEASDKANSEYGVLSVSGTTVTYTPDEVLQGVDFFTIFVATSLDNASTSDVNEEAGIAYRVYVIPATTVLYEESFATATSGTWTSTGTANAGNQETELAGTKSVNYGYTGAYTAVGATNGTELVSTTGGNKAEITFTGTGIEIYANCDTTTGTVAVLLYGKNADGTDKLEKLYQVKTVAKNGTTGATDDQNVISYSLPIVSITDLEHDTYKVVLQHTGVNEFLGDIRLDGFRVHNTLGDLESTAYPTAERNPTFLELRNAVLTGLNVTPDNVESLYEYAETLLSQVYANEGSSANMALVLGTDEALNVQDLLDNGPKNELFLWPGESVTFNLGSAKAQVGLKALNATTSYTISGVEGTKSIGTSADMFYHDLTGTIVIQNTGTSGVLSVTKLKLFGASQLQPLTVEDVAYALSVIGYTDGNPAPERPGAPVVNPFADVSEDTWYFDAVMWAVKNGITNGADETHFLPDALCQRAAVVTFLWRAAGSPEPENEVNPFVDVKEGDFFYKAVLWAVENGITNGSDATHFNPFGNANRAQVVTFLWRANGQPETTAEIPFSDVAEGQWYTQAVAWAVANSVTNGMSATEFGVNANCNRAQIVTFLYRASLIAA